MRLFRPAWDSKNEYRAVRAVNKLTDETKLIRVVKEARCRAARKAAVEKITDQNVLVYFARNDNNDSDVRIAASHKLVEFDLEEDLLINLIRMLGNELKSSKSEYTRIMSADVLIAFYQRYGRNEIREYDDTFIRTESSGYSEYTDYHTDQQEECANCPCTGHSDYHADRHSDTAYSYDIKFKTEED